MYVSFELGGDGLVESSWKFRCKELEERLAAVENELTDSTKRFAKHIAQLKLKLHEKDMQLMGGFGSPLALMDADVCSYCCCVSCVLMVESYVC